MGYGLISGSEGGFHLCLTSNPLCRRSTMESFGCVCFNTHLPKITISIGNRSGSFRDKAAVNDRFVTAEMNFYELLGISESGSFSEIKQAYKQLALKYHPDVSPPERMEEHTKRFIEVQEAYETLSDPNRRAMYDMDLAKGFHLAFSGRRGRYEEDLEERINWKNNWESQLEGLQKRRMYKESKENMSWGARMRRRNKSL
ncbi:chaperone protein dnaJ 20, chloroplastic-like [Telopea speciosissima]|uniref:chaperone protein dnaJ 20, chloroplastic-like n=1 Tax=Telopea speciosissima TaxID=54955 RepID=UPI001CC7E92C|nr:chaperone protein dnaJ 20, chloroplastic-like [Telopea speciosissima]